MNTDSLNVGLTNFIGLVVFYVYAHDFSRDHFIQTIFADINDVINTQTESLDVSSVQQTTSVITQNFTTTNTIATKGN